MKRRQVLAAAGLAATAGCLGQGSDDASDESGDEASATTDIFGNESESNATNHSDTDPQTEDPDPEPANEPTGREVSFESCTRATVTGYFEGGDVAFANTGFYDDGHSGNTILEDGVVFGDEIIAPFEGTVVFEIGAESRVDKRENRVTITVPEYGSDGTVITSLTTEQEDYLAAGATHQNPQAEACLEEIKVGHDPHSDERQDSAQQPEGNGDEAGRGQKGTFRVISLDHNTPVHAGDDVVATARIRNVGEMAGTQTVRFIVGHTPEVVDTRQLTLAPNELVNIDLQYTSAMVRNDQEFPIVVETDDDAAERSVLVYGTNA